MQTNAAYRAAADWDSEQGLCMGMECMMHGLNRQSTESKQNKQVHPTPGRCRHSVTGRSRPAAGRPATADGATAMCNNHQSTGKQLLAISPGICQQSETAHSRTTAGRPLSIQHQLAQKGFYNNSYTPHPHTWKMPTFRDCP